MLSFPGSIAPSFLPMLGSLQSQASLEFTTDREGRTLLTKRRMGGLFHVGKPYREGDTLAVQIVNPTAGLFAGDEMDLTVALGDGTQVELSSPSASRFYAMADRPARIHQRLIVGRGAGLEFHPNWVVPQQGSSVTQKTRIEVAAGGELAYFDCLSPGRVRHGEQYRFQRYVTSLELEVAGELCAKERMVLESSPGGWPLAVPGWEVCFYGAVWLVGESVEENFKVLANLERKLTGPDLMGGVTRQGPGVVVIRILAARSLLIKKSFTEIRRAAAPFLKILSRDQRIPQT